MEPLLDGLNEAQLQAVTHGDGPLLIVAGAGTGKTTVLTRRYAHLLEANQIKTEQVLAVTFTEKAAGEMEDRVLKLLPNGTYDFWISTFHGFCQRVLEAHALEIGLPNQFRLFTPTDAWLLLRRRFPELPLDHYRPLGNPIKFLRSLLQHVSRAKDEGVTPERYLDFVKALQLDADAEAVEGEKKRLQELADLYFVYRKIMWEEGNLDFGDLILETLRLFRERPAVLDAYRKQFRYILVDEFQDTNWAQYELIKLLAGAERNLTVVGDDDQAIYKFRGASLANILQFRDDFPDAKTVALTQNYRSRKEILDTAYHFIKKNDPNRLEVRLKDTGLSKELGSERGEGGRIEVLWKRTVEDEADAIAERIKRLKKDEPDTSWDDFAILVRSNDGAEPFVRALEQHDVPFQFMALRGLYAKTPVLDVVALLTLLEGYRESAPMWRALNLPCYGFAQRDIAEMLQYANRKGWSLWDAAKRASDRLMETGVSEEGMKLARAFVTDIEGLAESARREPPLRTLQKTMDRTGYLRWLMKQPEEKKRESLQHLNSFADRLRRYESSTHGPTLRGFLDEYKMETESGEEGALNVDPDAGPELVKIMTVHAAKGLEFKHVFLVSLVDQRFPTRARSEAIPLPDGLVQERLPEGDLHLEEERRLFYVALTRARDSLTLSGAEHYGGTRAKKPSAFIEETGFSVPDHSTNISDEAKRLMPPEDQELSKEPATTFYDLKRRFSFTQLAAFRKCPLQYKFAHIYRIPVLGSFQKSFGQSVHLALQRILELQKVRSGSVQVSLFGAEPPAEATPGGFRVTEEEAQRIFEESWIDEWYETRASHDEFFAKGKAAVKRFWQECAVKAPDVVELEKPFTLVLGAHSIKGKIDRIDRLPDGTVAVYDYKTGKAKEKLDAEDKEQLYLYQVALEEKGMKVGKLAYVFVLDWIESQVEPLQGSAREGFIEKMTERMDAILASDFKAKPDAMSCKYCDFKNICEFREL